MRLSAWDLVSLDACWIDKLDGLNARGAGIDACWMGLNVCYIEMWDGWIRCLVGRLHAWEVGFDAQIHADYFKETKYLEMNAVWSLYKSAYYFYTHTRMRTHTHAKANVQAHTHIHQKRRIY